MARFLLALVALLALASCTQADVSPKDIVSGINAVTSKSKDLQAPANSITVTSGILIVVGQGPFPQIIAGFSQIITLATDDIQALASMDPVSAGPDADAIFDAFREFVRVHQDLLNILIGKAGLFSSVPFVGQPVSQVLRSLEAVVDTLAFSVIDKVQARTDDFKASADSLDRTLQAAIKSYTPSATEVASSVVTSRKLMGAN